MPSERRPRRSAGLRRATVSLLGVALLAAASIANAGILLGDTNCDGQVDQVDFDTLLAGLFGVDNGCPGLDVNGDGVISSADVVALLQVLPPPAPTATPTPTPITPTATFATATATGFATATPTPSITPSPSQTATVTITITPGGPTLTPSSTATVTRTPTNTKFPTRTETGTETPTATRTATRTRTQTRTRTPTDTPSPGRTRSTRTDTPTETPTPSATVTAPTFTVTATGSVAASNTPTVTRTPTGNTPTASRTATDTRTPTITKTPSITKTPTITVTPSNTRTPSLTATQTRTTTATRTATVTPVPTDTRTPTLTRTVTFTRTPSRTATATATRTPTRTVTPTVPRPFGPEITFFGLATAGNKVRTPAGQTADGVPIYDWPNNFGFIIVVEGRAGTSNRPLAQCGVMGTGPCADGRSAVQVLANRSLGNGSPAVCDTTPPNAGGVPAVAALDFGPSQMVTDAINDLGCRFDIHQTSPTACTFDALGNPAYVHDGTGGTVRSTLQYCSVPVVGAELAFPSGLTRLKVQVEDSVGNIGSQAQIAVQVP